MISGTLLVPCPLHQARNTTLYYYRDNNILPSISSILNNETINENQLSRLSRVTLQVCYLYNCRIQEVLNATINDIIHPDRVVLHGVKRGGSYIIYLPGLSDQVHALVQVTQIQKIFPVTYIKLYRDALRAGIRFSYKNKKNSNVLHSGRFEICKKIGTDLAHNEISDIMHHKSKSSVSYYLP